MGEPNKLHQIDIEKRQKAEIALGEAEEIFKLLVSAVQDYAIFALDPLGYVRTWNAGAQRLKGYTAEEIIGSHFSRFYTPEDIARKHPQEELKIAVRDGRYEEEGWRIRKDGSRFWANVVITALRGSDGKLRGFAKVTRDLTEKKKAEEARIEEQRNAATLEQIRENERLFDEIFSLSPSFVTIVSFPELRYLKSNNGHRQLIHKSDIIGKTIQEVIPEVEAHGFIDLLKKVGTTGKPLFGYETPFVLKDPDGVGERTHYLDFVWQPLKRPDGSVHSIAIQGYDVTEKVVARKTTEAEREKLYSLLMQAPIPMCALEGPEYRFTVANPQFDALVRRKVVGKRLREAFLEEEASPFLSILENVYRTGKPFTGKEMPFQLLNAQGERRDLYLNFGYHPFRAVSGEIQGVIAVVNDVTDYVIARRKLGENAALMNAISEATPDFLFVKNRAGRMIFANPAMAASLGQRVEDILGRTDIEFLGEEIGRPIVENDRRILESGKAESVEEVLNVEGQRRVYITNKVPYRGRDGEVVGLIGVSRDVTELRKAREKAELNELRYRTLTEALPQLVWGSAPDGRCDFLSKQWLEYTGISEEKQLGWAWIDLVVHPEDRERTYRQWMGATQGLHPYDVEYRMRRHDGVYRWFKVRGTPMRNEAGEITYWFGSCTDIEDQRQTFNVLKTVNEVGPIISAELDLSRVVQLVTDTATQLSGAQMGAFFYHTVGEKGEALTLYSLSGVSKEMFSKFPMPRNTNIFSPTLSGKDILRSDDITTDPRYGKNQPYHGLPEGHPPVTSFLSVPVISRTGEVMGGLFFGHSKRAAFSRQSEEIIKGLAAQAAIAIDNARLYQRSQDAIRHRDDFLSIASHELKTPLTGMKIQTQMFNRVLKRDTAAATKPARVSHLVNVLDRGLDRLVRLVEDMLDISRIRSGKLSLLFEPVDLTKLVGETMERLRAELAHARIELRLDLSEGVSATVDPFRIEQVITNLVINAIRYASKAPLDVTLRQTGDRVVLRFQDHGPGIHVEDQGRLFRRFERLISANEISGMGLGLYICKEIVEGHHGTIRLESEEGKGACFIVELPLDKPAGSK